MWHVWGEEKFKQGIGAEMRKIDHLEDLDVDDRIIIRSMLKEKQQDFG
jgi:hypothetical protein